jgi:Na+-driven multidrug efflux pump
MPAFAVGSAVSSMAAQNVGAGRWDGVARIARDGVVYNVRLTAAPTARIAPAAVVTSPEQS